MIKFMPLVCISMPRNKTKPDPVCHHLSLSCNISNAQRMSLGVEDEEIVTIAFDLVFLI